MSRVVQLGPGERHVTDGGVEVPAGKTRVSEGLGANVSVRVQRLGDAGGDRVQLDTGHGRRFGCEANEGSGTGSRFEDAATVETERVESLPDFRGEGRIGVVRVDDGTVRGPVLVLAQQLA